MDRCYCFKNKITQYRGLVDHELSRCCLIPIVLCVTDSFQFKLCFISVFLRRCLFVFLGMFFYTVYVLCTIFTYWGHAFTIVLFHAHLSHYNVCMRSSVTSAFPLYNKGVGTTSVKCTPHQSHTTACADFGTLCIHKMPCPF